MNDSSRQGSLPDRMIATDHGILRPSARAATNSPRRDSGEEQARRLWDETPLVNWDLG